MDNGCDNVGDVSGISKFINYVIKINTVVNFRDY